MARVEDVELLLRDYNNYLPGGCGEAFVPTGGTGYGASTPLTPEMERRWSREREPGRTWWRLDSALKRLEKEHPLCYLAIRAVHLRDEAGWADLDYLRRHRRRNRTLLALHDKGVMFLASYLGDEPLYVERPKVVSAGAVRGMAEANAELVSVYSRLRQEGMSRGEAVETAASMLGFAPEHARRVVRRRLGQGA